MIYPKDVQVKFLVVEHRLARVLHDKRRVLYDVPLENLLPWRTMRYCVAEYLKRIEEREAEEKSDE